MSKKENSSSSSFRYLQNGGEMGELTRCYDWSGTVLGNPETWSQSLLTTLGIVLKSKFPMFLWWGKELIQFYNDAYRPSLGNQGKHPLALGQRGEDCWTEIWPEIKPMIDKVVTFGESSWNEDRLIAIYRNGKMEDVYWTFSFSQVIDGSGKVGGVLVICSETTEKVNAIQEQKEREKIAQLNYEKLVFSNIELIKAQGSLSQAYHHVRLQEMRFKNIIEQAPVAIAIFKGPEFIIEVYNNKVLEFWGRTARQVKNKPLFEALPEVSNQGFEELLATVLSSGETLHINEMPLKLFRNGTLEMIWINFIYEPVRDLRGLITGVMVICIEITEQVNATNKAKESAKEFRQVADSVTQMIWVADGAGMHEYYNQRWYDFTGTDYEQVKGIGWNKMYHPDDQERAWEVWKHSLKTGTPYEIEYRLRNKSGAYFWVLGRAAPFKDANGVITKWFGTCTDINEQKLLMQQKDDFMSIASHELKSPLTSLTASLQLLDRIKDNPSHQMFPSLIDRANKCVDKINLLIKNLLDVTQFNNGQLHLDKSPVTLFKLVDNCCTQIRTEGIYTVTIKGIQDIEVLIDPLRISQVIDNLISNAVKYAPNSKEIVITIEKAGEMAVVSVTDQGQGISPDKIPYLFDRYFRVDNKGSQYSGLGLGLYISGEIIKHHEGTIGANSKVGSGTTFWFTLPINKIK